MASKYEKQSNGEYIEIYDISGNLVAEFEFFGKVFVGWDYDSDDEEIIDLQDSYNLTDEYYPKELNDMLNVIKGKYPSLKIAGFNTFKKTFELE